jgi:hypothetical protein
LSEAVKIQLSHRAKALAILSQWLQGTAAS